MTAPIIEASCHCGAVRLDVKTPPDSLTDCNCSICRRYGVLWAYYPTKDVSVRLVPDALEFYMWGDRSIRFNRCKLCGCITHWSAIDPAYERMAVNARLMDPAVLRPLRIRKLDGAVTGQYLR